MPSRAWSAGRSLAHHTWRTRRRWPSTRGAERHVRRLQQGALLGTTDGGASWRELDSYYTPDDVWYRDIHQVVLRPTAPDELFMTTGIGLYHSPDRGQSWTHLTDPSFRIGYPDQLVITPDGAQLYMAGAEHDPTTWRHSHQANSTVLHSVDSGRTWAPAAGGLPEPQRANIEALTLASYPGGHAALRRDHGR